VTILLTRRRIRTDYVAMMMFSDRRGAGRQLGARLVAQYANRDDVVVLALPRGGVPVGYEVALALAAPLDIFVVRKLGVPGQEELALGAVASGGSVVYNEEVLGLAHLPQAALDFLVDEECHELIRREQAYRGECKPLPVRGRTVIIVDDGLATGASMRAAVRALRQQAPARIAVAVPVGPADSIEALRRDADEVVCLASPDYFRSVSIWYVDFPQVTDEEVRDLLARASQQRMSAVTG
jgi:predicted phosphoribosyltransferase